MNWTAKDEEYKNKLNAVADKETLEWMKEKSKDIERIMAYYRCAMMEIETKFRVLNVEYSLKNDRNPISNIQSRLKSMSSIKDKLDRRGKGISLTALENDIFDIAGVRVVCSFPEDVYEIAEAFLKQDDIRLIEIKDYIKNPKPNG